MIDNKFPINNSNADVIIEKLVPKTKMVMIRFEAVFDYLSEEPAFISIKEKEDSMYEKYNCALRIRIWNSSKKSYSWSIYFGENQEINNLVIRKVTWDIDKDIAFAKSNIKENREMVLKTYPSISIDSEYIPHIESNRLIQMIKEFDEVIGSGFVLNDNINPTWEWRDLEIIRLYDWGKIHFIWCTNKKNDKVEEKIKELIFHIDMALNNCTKRINLMDLEYSITPEQFKKSYIEV